MRERSAGPARCPRLSPHILEIDRVRITGRGFSSMPRLPPADAIKALLYCGEAFVD
jgi:hypothetical protein